MKKKGDVKCMAHFINFVVQDALKSLEADPEADINKYHSEDGFSDLPHNQAHPSEVTSFLEKLRRHIYVFRNRRGWRDCLEKQSVAAGLQALDMPMRLTSTAKMLIATLDLRSPKPITTLCASQSHQHERNCCHS